MVTTVRLSTVKVLLQIIGGAYRPDREPAAAPGQGQDVRTPFFPSGKGGQGSPASRPRRRKKWVYLVLLTGLIIVGLAVPYVGHALLNPWAISLTGQPTLTGYWQGEVVFAPGDQRRVVIDLRSDPGRGGCPDCSPIDGDLRVCARARPMTYRFTGKVQGRHARRFSLSVTPGDRAGIYLRWLDGEWAGGDQIGLTATLVVRDADGAIRSDHQPAQPARFTMRRGNKANFTATC
jgi:hypothetical protein